MTKISPNDAPSGSPARTSKLAELTEQYAKTDPVPSSGNTSVVPAEVALPMCETLRSQLLTELGNLTLAFTTTLKGHANDCARVYLAQVSAHRDTLNNQMRIAVRGMANECSQSLKQLAQQQEKHRRQELEEYAVNKRALVRSLARVGVIGAALMGLTFLILVSVTYWVTRQQYLHMDTVRLELQQTEAKLAAAKQELAGVEMEISKRVELTRWHIVWSEPYGGYLVKILPQSVHVTKGGTFAFPETK